MRTVEWQDLQNLSEKIQRQLANKSDCTVFQVEVRNMKDQIARIEEISRDASKRSMNHVCHQSDILSEIRHSIRAIHGTLESWKSLKIAAVVAILISILSGALFLFRVISKQDVLNVEMTALKETIKVKSSRDDKVLENLQLLRDNIQRLSKSSQP